MKQFLFILGLLLLVILPLPVHGIDLGDSLVQQTASQAGYDPGTTDTTFSSTLGYVVKLVLSFVGVIFLILMVYAGFLWMTARGEQDQVDKAEKIIRSAIIGLIITTGAYSLTAFILPKILSRTSTPSGSLICCSICSNGTGTVGGQGARPGGCSFSVVSDRAACSNLCQGQSNMTCQQAPSPKTVETCTP